MSKKHILIIEDHHLMVEGYKNMFSLSDENVWEITSVRNCEEAFKLLTKVSKSKYDFVFLDWNLPAFEEKKLQNGGDLISLIESHSSDSKLVVFTSHTDAITLYQIIQKARPNALLCKIDFMLEDFPILYAKLIKGEIYYSRTVQEQLKQITSRTTYLDNYNRQIILLLSKGVKTKNMPLYLPLSISAIDKRKAQIKDYFLLEKGNDEDIIREAKRNNLI